eukprot:857750-Pelagomonas_calceolata.AAC.2
MSGVALVNCEGVCLCLLAWMRGLLQNLLSQACALHNPDLEQHCFCPVMPDVHHSPSILFVPCFVACILPMSSDAL